MPTFYTSKDGEQVLNYLNPFYQSVNKFVRRELDERAKLYGQRVRGIGAEKPIGVEWSYQKTAWATAQSVKHSDIILGTAGSNVMSDSKGNLSLYNAERNVPNKPLLTKVEIANEGQLGSFLKANISFTVFPRFSTGGFDFGKLEDAFFVPGREVDLKWGWSVAASSKRASQGSLTGIIYNFNWQFNTDMSVTATVSIISPSGLALGLSGDLTNKSSETTIVEDPSGRILIGSNLSTVIDSDLAAFAQEIDGSELEKGQLNYYGYDLESNLNKKFDYYAIGIPIQETVDNVTTNTITKAVWYVKLSAVTQFVNELLDQFDDPIKQIVAVQSWGNQSQYNQNVISAYPMDVFFPDRLMGQYGTFRPFGNGDETTNPLTYNMPDGTINIGEILLSTDFVKSTYNRFVKENSGNSNIQYKNITTFFEEILKRINQSTGDAYQFTCILFEPKLNNIEGESIKSILSIEDANLSTTLEVDEYNFNANIFKPLIRSVNISSEPPPQVATAAFVAARGNAKPEQTNVQVSRAKDRDIPTFESEFTSTLSDAAYLLWKGGGYGFSDSWSEQMRGFLVKLKRTSTSSDAHWLHKAIYPVNFSVTLDGINGFKFGDTLTTNLIPSIYNSEYGMVFTVTKLSHVIENKDWQTTLTTVARLNGYSEDAAKAGSIHDVPGAYASQPGLTTPRIVQPEEAQ
jgi:hypothetical protein